MAIFALLDLATLCACGGGATAADMAGLPDLTLMTSCNDKLRDGKETDIDCGGGDCGPCPPGHTCRIDADCAAGGFCVNGLCGTRPSCHDGVKNGAETDVDCGGSECPPCPLGEICQANRDCGSGFCSGSLCDPVPTCGATKDAKKDGLETDVDCGGPDCPPCAAGMGCARSRDCTTTICAHLACAPFTCIDGKLDGNETDLDCGGACLPCGPGKACLAGADCNSTVCIAGDGGPGGACAAARCDDGIQNGSESDVDCGGGECPKCASGKMCRMAVDCLPGVCTKGLCVAPPSCMDGVQNFHETDVDCGGGLCPVCAAGKRCAINSDCASGQCKSSVCA